MDLNMPVMDGFEASKRILSLFRSHPERALSATHQVNIVALTSYTDQRTIDRCQEIGMADVYHKPLKKEEMREMIAIYYMGLTKQQYQYYLENENIVNQQISEIQKLQELEKMKNDKIYKRMNSKWNCHYNFDLFYNIFILIKINNYNFDL